MIHRPILILSCLLILWPVLGSAQTSDLPVRTKSAWTSELGSSETWGILALGVVGAALVLDLENPDTAHKTLDDSVIDSPMELGDLYGSGWGVGLLGLSTLTAGVVSGEPAARDFGRDVLISFAASSVLSAVIKSAVARTRPNGDRFSFPSGHTTAAFSSVVPIWRHGGREAGLAATGLAVMTGLARMEQRKHYLSDVIAGAALGLAVGRVVTAVTEEPDWSLTAGPSGLGLSRAF